MGEYPVRTLEEAVAEPQKMISLRQFATDRVIRRDPG